MGGCAWGEVSAGEGGGGAEVGCLEGEAFRGEEVTGGVVEGGGDFGEVSGLVEAFWELPSERPLWEDSEGAVSVSALRAGVSKATENVSAPRLSAKDVVPLEARLPHQKVSRTIPRMNTAIPPPIFIQNFFRSFEVGAGKAGVTAVGGIGDEIPS